MNSNELLLMYYDYLGYRILKNVSCITVRFLFPKKYEIQWSINMGLAIKIIYTDALKLFDHIDGK